MSRQPSVLPTMVGVAMACGFAIALVFQATAGQIERNRAELLEQAVAEVLPGVATMRGYAIADDVLTDAATDQAQLIAGYDQTGALVGVALPARIMGYQDTIRMLFGYDPVSERLTGFTVLDSRETPGLGSKIDTDPDFLASLKGLDVELAGHTLANEATLATWGAERAPWQVDGITGATVSSHAVIQAINDTAPALAAIRAQLPALRSASKVRAESTEGNDA